MAPLSVGFFLPTLRNAIGRLLQHHPTREFMAEEGDLEPDLLSSGDHVSGTLAVFNIVVESQYFSRAPLIEHALVADRPSGGSMDGVVASIWEFTRTTYVGLVVPAAPVGGKATPPHPEALRGIPVGQLVGTRRLAVDDGRRRRWIAAQDLEDEVAIRPLPTTGYEEAIHGAKLPPLTIGALADLILPDPPELVLVAARLGEVVRRPTCVVATGGTYRQASTGEVSIAFKAIDLVGQ